MASLYLTEQGVVLRKTGKRLVVTRQEEVLLEVPCHQIDSVMLFGGIDFTTPAARQLCEHGISLALLTRRGKLVCRLAPPTGKNVTLRLAQYDRSRDDVFCLRLARALVSAKLRNAAALVRQHADNYGAAEFRADLDELEQSGERIATAGDLAAILGVEGNAARVYFGALRKMLRVPMAFPGRERRPPPDPVNALLSLGYTMLFNEVASLIEAAGLDPYVGFYHQVDYGRRSLAADLVHRRLDRIKLIERRPMPYEATSRDQAHKQAAYRLGEDCRSGGQSGRGGSQGKSRAAERRG